MSRDEQTQSHYDDDCDTPETTYGCHGAAHPTSPRRRLQEALINTLRSMAEHGNVHADFRPDIHCNVQPELGRTPQIKARH
jgi:hypothetical protein